MTSNDYYRLWCLALDKFGSYSRGEQVAWNKFLKALDEEEKSILDTPAYQE